MSIDPSLCQSRYGKPQNKVPHIKILELLFFSASSHFTVLSFHSYIYAFLRNLVMIRSLAYFTVSFSYDSCTAWNDSRFYSDFPFHTWNLLLFSLYYPVTLSFVRLVSVTHNIGGWFNLSMHPVTQRVCFTSCKQGHISGMCKMSYIFQLY